MKRNILVAVLFSFLFVGICVAQSFQMQFPLNCTINKNCWIMNYVDNDKTAEAHDYKGGNLTVEGHKGIDIAIKDIHRMNQGVNVLAVASGFVVSAKDGFPDKNALLQTTSQQKTLGCGNRVSIKHIGNWTTNYCHMKQGSIKVKTGDFVSGGQVIGQVGLSGMTDFPHLHINVQKNNQFYDPFTGFPRFYKGNTKTPLWTSLVLKQLVYSPHVIYNAGVSNEVPSLANIRIGKYMTKQINSKSNVLVFWIDAFHVQCGDCFTVVVKNLDGTNFLAKNIIVSKDNINKVVYIGKKKNGATFNRGTYSVKISLKRQKIAHVEIKNFNFAIY